MTECPTRSTLQQVRHKLANLAMQAGLMTVDFDNEDGPSTIEEGRLLGMADAYHEAVRVVDEAIGGFGRFK